MPFFAHPIPRPSKIPQRNISKDGNRVVSKEKKRGAKQKKFPRNLLHSKTKKGRSLSKDSSGGASRKTPPPEFGADLLSRPSGSTIGAGGLNFSVRDGKRWVPAAVGAFSLLAGGFPPGGCDCHEPGTNERRSRGPYGQLVPLGFAVAGFAPAAYRRRRLRRP